jgi:putative lipoprotein
MGTASYRERIALRPTAVLVVRLQEVSQQDASPKLISQQRYPVRHQPRHPKKQVPILFEVRYNPDLIQPSSRYQVSAHIEDGGRLLFVADTPSPVITGYPNHADLLLKRPPSDPGSTKPEATASHTHACKMSVSSLPD